MPPPTPVSTPITAIPKMSTPLRTPTTAPEAAKTAMPTKLRILGSTLKGWRIIVRVGGDSVEFAFPGEALHTVFVVVAAFLGDGVGAVLGAGVGAARHLGLAVGALVGAADIGQRQPCGGHAQAGEQQRTARCSDVHLTAGQGPDDGA